MNRLMYFATLSVWLFLTAIIALIAYPMIRVKEWMEDAITERRK